MSSFAPASECRRLHLSSLLFFGDYLPLSPRERRYNILWWHFADELSRVRRWFVKALPIHIRESVMTFLDHVTADSIPELELEFHHPELTKARYRRQLARPHSGDGFPSYKHFVL